MKRIFASLTLLAALTLPAHADDALVAPWQGAGGKELRDLPTLLAPWATAPCGMPRPSATLPPIMTKANWKTPLTMAW